jgi:acyl carrier protein
VTNVAKKTTKKAAKAKKKVAKSKAVKAKVKKAPAKKAPAKRAAAEAAPKPEAVEEARGVAEDDEIKAKVISIVANHMTVDETEITRETSFVNDLNADSLDTVELVMDFEDAFELSIPDEEAEKIQTVGQAIDYIKEHTSRA